MMNVVYKSTAAAMGHHPSPVHGFSITDKWTAWRLITMHWHGLLRHTLIITNLSTYTFVKKTVTHIWNVYCLHERIA